MPFVVHYVGGPLDGSLDETSSVPASQRKMWGSSAQPTHYVLMLIELAGTSLLVYVAHDLALDSALHMMSERSGLPRASASVLAVGSAGDFLDRSSVAAAAGAS